MIMQPLSLIRNTIICLLFISSTGYSESFCSKKMEVLDKVKGSYVKQARTLNNLSCNGGFDGKYFKIVKDVDENAISFDDHPELVRSAANAYYHLSLARTFWVDNIKSNYVNELGKLTIRINITNDYSKFRHFKHKDQVERYNNARTVPAGKTPRFVNEQKSWGKEIWFRPKKIIKTDKTKKSVGNNPVYRSLNLIKEPIWELNKNGLIYQGLSLIADNDIGNDSSFLNSAISRVGALAALYIASEVTVGMDNFFTNDFYYINTAMVPEIIYHEFAHIAMADTLKPVHHVPVIEGMADYFTSRMIEGNILYEPIEGESMNLTKDTQNKSLYHPYLEEEWNATNDFVLSLIWKARDSFVEANKKRRTKGQPAVVNFDQLVFDTHFKLNEESDIMRDLTQALIQSCLEKCRGKRIGLEVLHNSFEDKGLN